MRANIGLLAKVLLVFGGLGPLVGLAVFAGGAGVLFVAGGRPDGFWITPFLLIYGLIFAHFVGGPWALLAGLVATVGAVWRRDLPTWIGPASGLISFAVAGTMGDVGEVIRRVPEPGSTVDSFQAGYVGLLAAAHVGAATVCWLVARCWLRRGVAGSISAGA